ncbi:outer membrane protein assembly factor BamB family protein [Streptomyces aureocirculatus]|uniref:outer membrane protein assembly factor BamB family protein n=1 Tax=Streptomyces aureocirculatus TaxID=67275 RepID=UPI0012FF398A|nr:PQQ-binding-like beta-propeller repeat protein [Streptomyces aureocirculatus]
MDRTVCHSVVLMKIPKVYVRLLKRALAIAVVCALAACSHPGMSSAKKAPHGASSNSAADSGGSGPAGPPQKFESQPSASIDMQDNPVEVSGTLSDVLTLGDTLAYLYDGDGSGITAYRLDTGDAAWHTSVPDSDGQSGTPRLAGTAVVGAFATSTEGAGTSAGHHAITVVAYNAATGRQRWSTDFARANGTDQTLGTPRVVAADNAHVLVSVAEEGYSETLPMSALLDVRTGSVIWTDRDFDGVNLTKTVAVGATQGGNTFVGKAVSDGHQVWSRTVPGGELLTEPLGPGLTKVDAITGDPDNLLLYSATGKSKLTLDSSVSGCLYDGQATLVCTGDDVVGVDVSTARVLWYLPDRATNRAKPDVYCAWHGVVYAAGTNSLVTLDARTGKDLHTHIGAAPVMVNDRYGLKYDDSTGERVNIYRATG